MGEALRHVASCYPNRIALIHGEERVTYQQFYEGVQALAQHLHGVGVSKGDRMATLLWSNPEYIYLFFAAAELGAVIAPLPPRLRRKQMETLLRELEPKAVFTSTELEVRDGLEALYTLKNELPMLDHVIVVDELDGNKPKFEEMLISPPTGKPIPVQIQLQDPLAILYTSGTTGRAKGVIHSHRGLITPVVASIRLREMWMTFFPSFGRVKRWLRVLFRYGARLLRAAGRQQTMLSTMAMHTISGLEAMLQALLMGDRLVLLPRFHPVRTLETIQRERVSILIGVPLSYLTMMRVRDFDRYRLSSLLICATGAAPCPPELARQIQQRFRCAVHIGFGMTELGGGVSASMLDDPPDRQTDTVGRAMPGMEVVVVDDQHRPLPSGKIGELACRSSSQMLGYFGDASLMGEIVDEEGFFYTGDLAMIDEEGYIHIVGRKKDVIIRGGQNIHPAKIENLLVEIPGVREVAVVGVPDALGTESVWSFVILEDGTSLNERSIVDYSRSHLELYEIPERVRFVKDFPRASTGKPQKYKLREMALEEMRSREENN